MTGLVDTLELKSPLYQPVYDLTGSLKIYCIIASDSLHMGSTVYTVGVIQVSMLATTYPHNPRGRLKSDDL